MTIYDKSTRLHKAQIAHYSEAEKYNKFHLWVGIPILVLSAITNLGVLYKVDFSEIDLFSIGLLITTFLVTILASFQTFLNFEKKAEEHRTSAVKYGKLRRGIDLLKTLKMTKDDQKEYLIKLNDEWNTLAEMAPVTPKKTRDKAR